jgi:serine phosphatase RsbU (regulator of sigma subunit)
MLSPRAEVTIYSPLFTPFRKPLEEELVSIGRASDCTIPIKDRYLSRRHAEIISQEGAWVIKDLGSANGTYLNGSRLEVITPLRSGDRIRLGDTELVFESEEHKTDRIFAIASDTVTRPTIALSVHEIEDTRPSTDAQDVSRLKTLNALARELIEDRPLDQLFGFIVDRVMEHLKPSRAAIALLAPGGQSFDHVELRRADQTDKSELTISQTLLETVVRDRQALACLDVQMDEKLSHAKSLIMQGIRSIICAPISIGESVFGVLYIDFMMTQKAIAEEDVRLVAQIARFASAKLETTRLREEAIQKRLMDEELKTASMIQRRLLRAAPTGIEGYTFIGTNQPCRTVSGDYYDFVVRDDGTVDFVIADVSGKGVTAGLMMAGLQVAFRIFAKPESDLSLIASQLNSTLRENLPRSKFVTLFVGRLRVATGGIEYVNCGHTPPFHVHQTGVHELNETDILLGVVNDAKFTTRHLHLGAGDSLVLFTDGVTEAQGADGEELGGPAVGVALGKMHGRPANIISHTVEQTVLRHVPDPEELGDDVTMLVISRDLY